MPTHGDIFDTFDPILLNIGYSELNANWNWKKVYSPFARIYHVVGGEAQAYINGRIHKLEADYLYLIPPFTLHDDECNSFFALYYVHFYEKTINKESLFDRYSFPIGIQATPLDLLVIDRLLTINPERHLPHFDPQLYDNPPTFSQNIADNNKMPLHSIIETRGILYQLMSKFLMMAKIKSGEMDIRIHKCLKYIHENIEKDISISNLAGIAYITEDHLIRLFKRETQYTPIKYINLKKIEKAQLLLLTTDMPIKDIAYELLSDNVSYFNRIFKQHTGKTPSQYREEFST